MLAKPAYDSEDSFALCPLRSRDLVFRAGEQAEYVGRDGVTACPTVHEVPLESRCAQGLAAYRAHTQAFVQTQGTEHHRVLLMSGR